MNFLLIKDCLQISPLILIEFSELISFYSPWNYQKTVGFLMISGGNRSYVIRLNSDKLSDSHCS